MSAPGHDFAQGGEPPIPKDVRPGKSWTPWMLEMADHIGAYRTLLLIEAFAGRRIYVPADWTRGKAYDGAATIRGVVGDQAAQILSRVYRREYIQVPTAKSALFAARRGPIIASIRANLLSIKAGARALGTTPSYLSHLVNHSEEGEGAELALDRPRRDPGQMDLFGEGEDD